MSLPATIIAILLTTAALIGAYTLVVRRLLSAIRWSRLLIAECHFRKTSKPHRAVSATIRRCRLLINELLFKKNQIRFT
jgi:hypothetical protein